MKTLTTLIACLCFGSAMAQTFPRTNISCAVYHADGICSWNNSTLQLDSVEWSKFGFFKSDTLTFRNNSFRNLNLNAEPIMKISDLKPDKSYEVWIDKKAIKWTSDSTFILKRKP